jgi:hypothetical protein
VQKQASISGSFSKIWLPVYQAWRVQGLLKKARTRRMTSNLSSITKPQLRSFNLKGKMMMLFRKEMSRKETKTQILAVEMERVSKKVVQYKNSEI